MSADLPWKQVSTNLAKRPLIGVEKLLNYAEYYQNGNFQLSIAMIFETNLPPETLRQRFGLALWIVRGFLPELGTWTVGTSGHSSLDLDHATFEAIQTVEDAQKWIDETAVLVEDGTTVQEVIDLTSNQRIEPAGKQFRALLVSNPREGHPAVIINASHVLNGHRMLFQGCAIVQALVDGRLAALTEADPDPRSALESIFAPEDLSRLLRKLPISLNTAYTDKFKPSEAELEAGMEKLGERLNNGAQPTIGIPRFEAPAQKPQYSLGTLNGEPMTMLNLRRQIGASEHRMLHQAYKKRGSTLPSFVYACIVNSIDRRFKANNAEDGETPGAHLAYSAHASRWFPQETFMSRSPVNMGVVLASGYLSPEELRSQQRERNLNEEELFTLAKTIRSKQEAYLDTPHIISTMAQVGDDVSNLIAETAVKQREAGTDPYVALCENSPAICPPTLTSQGDIPIKRLYTADGASFDPKPKQPEGEYIYFVKGILGGRTTDASVCFAMWSFSGILTIQAHFDSRFFDAKLIDTILDDVVSQLRYSATSAVEQRAEAKL
ncbi:hypothetical protein NDA16_002282 [Ustilago loliicola]|nr:hypothetical protein NDA16_002282 [Ustilago loliicola]